MRERASDILEIPDEWRRGWLAEDAFNRILALEGKIYRFKDGRRTLQFVVDGKSYFAKLHYGIGWGRFFKSLWRGKWPVSGAENEWQAVQILEKLEIPTTPLVAYGSRGGSLPNRQSFIITADLQNTISLEDFCRHWPVSPPALFFKRALIRRVAEITETLHRSGLNHNDLYICHFLLANESLETQNQIPHLSLIDLHRVRKRMPLPQRWRLKDLAALHFSSLHIGLSRSDRLRFIAVYLGSDWRLILRRNTSFWGRVERRAQALDREFKRRGPR